jgi:hypothetical protein
MAFPALALRARALAAGGYAHEACADIEALLDLWRKTAAVGSYWTADLAVAAAELGDGVDIGAALAAARPTPWVGAARAIREGDFFLAAELYERIGSRPDEAFARLRAGESAPDGAVSPQAADQLARALEFFRSVAARRYVSEGERFAAALS